MIVESLSFVELPLIELVAPLEGVVVVEGSSVEPVSLGASVDVAVVIEDVEDEGVKEEDVAVDCNMSCIIYGYRVDQENMQMKMVS